MFTDFKVYFGPKESRKHFDLIEASLLEGGRIDPPGIRISPFDNYINRQHETKIKV